MNTVNNDYSDERSPLDHMKKCLEARMKQSVKEDICLAFPGGVDSSLPLKTATDAAARTGRNVYTMTFDSRLHPSYDLEIARRVAEELEGTHEIITVDELEQGVIKNNPINRCYLYKCHLSSELAELAQARGIRYILSGINEGDMHVYHPGVQALKELGIINPLAELRITEAQVKALVSKYGISVTSRPSTPCVATRLSYGTVLDYEVLGRIGVGKTYVRTMVPGNVHLRLYGDITRLELDPEASDISTRRRKEIVSRLKEMGLVYITLDTEGFHPGSMDVGLTGLGRPVQKGWIGRIGLDPSVL